MSIHELYLLFSIEATHICTFAKLSIELQCLFSSYRTTVKLQIMRLGRNMIDFSIKDTFQGQNNWFLYSFNTF